MRVFGYGGGFKVSLNLLIAFVVSKADYLLSGIVMFGDIGIV